jgi:hypothetical protein
MTAPKSVDAAGFVREQLESASRDLLRAMVTTFAEALMSAEADAVCGAPYGQRSEERTNQRNGVPATGVGHPGRDGGCCIFAGARPEHRWLVSDSWVGAGRRLGLIGSRRW